MLDGDGVVTQARDETILLLRLCWATCDGCNHSEEKRQAENWFSLQNHEGSL
jgi:hypothetical protein